MSEAEVTSTRDDAELKAMLAMVRYLEPLDRAACSRVLTWASERYTKMHLEDTDLDAFTKFTESLVEAARSIGDVTPLEIVRFAEDVRSAKDAA